MDVRIVSEYVFLVAEFNGDRLSSLALTVLEQFTF